MSVINKMLRDLDQRQAKGTATAAPSANLQTGTAVLPGFAHASAQQPAPRRARPVLLVLACLVLALVIGASWWVAPRAAPASPAIDAGAVVAAAPTAPAAAAPPASLQAAASAPVVVEPTAPLVVSPASAPVLAPPLPVAASPTPAPAAPPTASAKREPTTLGLRMDTTLTPRKLNDRAIAPERASAQASELPKGPTPNEALERAQALWSTGSRDAAMDLLQEAVVVAERAGAGSNFAQGNPVLLPLVRELTRMQLAESRHSAVWDLLTRLEPQLGSAPDLWAIRGNAAQRLGRHQDSVHAYMAALQSRPNEQRWLLGAAVSLAALGQTRSATEMADMARAVGVVSPEVLAYLRQMGVPLKDK